MSDMITIDQAVAFGRTYGFSLLPDDDCPNGSVLGFSEPIYSLLHEKGHLVGEYWTRDIEFKEWLRAGICLVYSSESQFYLWDDELPESLTPFLKHAHLAEYIATPVPTVRLISKASLWEILPKYLKDIQNQDLPGPEPEEPCRLKIRSQAKYILQKHPDFSGRTMACDFERNGMECGIPACYSELAWVNNGVILIYLSGGSDSITRAWLLPIL